MLFSLGEESGDGWAEAFVERGRRSSFRRLIFGVGGTEPVALTTSAIIKESLVLNSRDVLPAGFALRQGPSSAADGVVGETADDPPSGRPLTDPNLLPGWLSVLGLGLNLPPIVHLSSVSAALSPS